jgi:hypothetical protein
MRFNGHEFAQWIAVHTNVHHGAHDWLRFRLSGMYILSALYADRQAIRAEGPVGYGAVITCESFPKSGIELTSPLSAPFFG